LGIIKPWVYLFVLTKICGTKYEYIVVVHDHIRSICSVVIKFITI